MIKITTPSPENEKKFTRLAYGTMNCLVAGDIDRYSQLSLFKHKTMQTDDENQFYCLQCVSCYFDGKNWINNNVHIIVDDEKELFTVEIFDQDYNTLKRFENVGQFDLQNTLHEYLAKEFVIKGYKLIHEERERLAAERAKG